MIKSGLNLVCNENFVYGNKSKNSQDYAQKPFAQKRNCTFMNSASGLLCR